MTSSPLDEADKIKREERQRKGFISGAIFAALMGLIAFSGAAGSPHFETFRTIDVIRLMTAGASIPVVIFLLVSFFSSPRRTPRM